ncbi:Cytochrome P450 3A24 [Halotydeus destructor]|nr:Cytochrome P450 3A24 [Halotydeus destructor]
MSVFYILVTVALMTVIYIYSYIKKKHSFWKNIGIPTPRILPVVGHALDNFLDDMHEVLLKDSKTVGRTYGVYNVVKPVLVTSDPELIKHITIKDSHVFVNHETFLDMFDETGKLLLFNMKDDQWRRVRNIVTPCFTSGKMKSMLPIMRKCSTDCATALGLRVGEDIDLRDIFGRYTVDVIAKCLFAFKSDFYDMKKPNQFLANAERLFKLNTLNFLLFLILPKSIFNFFAPEVFPHEAMRYFRQVVELIVKERRDKKMRGNDFLQLLLDAWEESSITDPKNSKKMTEEEMIPQAVMFLSAGYETTATWVGFIFYLLAMNPEIQERLYNEVSEGDLDYDKIMNYPYLDAVVLETLRMYPPLFIIGRTPSEDYTLPGTEMTIPKATEVQISVWSVHYDAENYPEPETFDPMRFMPENKDKIKPCTFLPFGSGIRNCVGMRFALLEGKLLVADMLSKYKFVKTARTPLKPKFRFGGGMLRFDPIFAGIEKRE